MGKLKHALNSRNTHLKYVLTLVVTFHMALLQIHTTPHGQGLLCPVTLLFNHPVCGVMPVIDRKSRGGDKVDEHHSKLVHRQHKNDTNNDDPPVFASFPIGSTVVFQEEDSGPWTHGAAIGKGDHNHHDQSYTIQITTTCRRITCNRQHIRLTSIRTDNYICYQATNYANRQTDPLDAILEYIKNNPMSYSNRTVQSNINKSTHNEQQPKTIHRKVDRNTYKEQ